MSEWTKLLRLQAQADKEAAITAVSATPVPTLFESSLTLGYARKALIAYNNTDNADPASGECFYSYKATASTSGESRPIPMGAEIEIYVHDNIDVYFFSVSGETGDLRIEELS